MAPRLTVRALYHQTTVWVNTRLFRKHHGLDNATTGHENGIRQAVHFASPLHVVGEALRRLHFFCDEGDAGALAG